ncbi:MAG TPA: HNH endonuclease [Actinomycetota bacterium]|nr:HNH endonuclease [Actinomycetota bacterium]
MGERVSHARPCEIHAYHSPHVSDTDLHHVVPLAWGGADELANEVSICPTGHRNVHELLREYAVFGGEPPWEVRRTFSVAERELARRAWEGASRA